MRRLSLFAALVALPALALTAQAAVVFRDIPPNHWARIPAGILAENNVMRGRTPLDFAGEVPLTRYELAGAISRLYNVDGPPAVYVMLNDMRTGHEYSAEVQRVMGFDLISARKAGVFDGDTPVTRREMAIALDTLLQKNGVSPPARRPDPVFFSDIPVKSPLYPVLDRVVNRFKLMESRTGTPFYPQNAMTRFQALALFVKVMPYVHAPIAIQLRDAMAPTPAPPGTPLPSGMTPAPTPTPDVIYVPTYMPATIAPATPVPVVTPAGGPILRSQANADGELVMMFSEESPTEAGAIVTGEQREFSGTMLPGGAISGGFWSGNTGGTLTINNYFIGLNVPHHNKQVPIDMLDTHAMGYGWYKVGSGLTWEAALGLGGVFRYTYNLTGDLIGTYYLTADKTYFGGGPGLLLGFRPTPALDLNVSTLAYPLFQSYNLPRGAKSITRYGVDVAGGANYHLGGGWTLDGGVHLFLSGALSGGNQTLFGVRLGAGYAF